MHRHFKLFFLEVQSGPLLVDTPTLLVELFHCNIFIFFRLNAKLDELRKARANEFIGKWEKSSSKTIKWMETCEKTMQFDIEEQQSLADVRERLDDVDVSTVQLQK